MIDMDANLDNNKWDPKYYKKCAHSSRTTCKYDKDCGLQTHPQGQFFYFLPQKEMLRSTLQNPPPPNITVSRKPHFQLFHCISIFWYAYWACLYPSPTFANVCVSTKQPTPTFTSFSNGNSSGHPQKKPSTPAPPIPTLQLPSINFEVANRR